LATQRLTGAEWLNDADEGLQKARADKAEIYCDSTFIDVAEPNDVVKDDKGGDLKENGKTVTVKDRFGGEYEHIYALFRTHADDTRCESPSC